MRSVVPVAAAGQATAALVAAFLIYPVPPAAAHKICGDTPVEVNVHVRYWSHGKTVAKALWRSCARTKYGDQWGSLELARAKRDFCYNVDAYRSYYRHQGLLTCDGDDDPRARWVCFYRATPCRYPGYDED
jgi:hypothetical protein